MSLRGEDISVAIDGNVLVREATLACAPGEVVALLGPNGAGKSTLLSALAGQRSVSGRVSIDQRALDDWAPDALARRRGVLRQRTHLPFGFSVREVIEMGQIPWASAPGRRPARRAEHYLEAVGLREFAERRYPTLSGGEKRRVQLARIMAQVRALEACDQPRYLLLDEPLASLDIAESARVLGLVRRLGRSGVGVLCVLHDLNAAATVADRVVLMRGGEIVGQGATADCMCADRLQACFNTPVSVTAGGGAPPTIRAILQWD